MASPLLLTRPVPPAVHRPERGGRTPSVAVRELPADTEHTRTARQWTKAVLGTWHVAQSLIDDALLVVAELTANAAEHGGRRMIIRLGRAGAALHISVADHGAGAAATLPRQRCGASLQEPEQEQGQGQGQEQERGRGLGIVAALCSTWMIELQDTGGLKVHGTLPLLVEPC
ncbi:ATP-binding protein [Kitasatospora sp. NE20-6]|uniref:ATP-binding protein n=1 Tax=Kitasatospora sp. NE20-6 TaxID=2859066 RepID=UPI0038B30046